MKRRQIIAAIAAAAITITSVFAGAPGTAYAMDSTTSIGSMKVNYLSNPLGISREDIRFSWNMSSDLIGQGQKSYRIMVYEDTIDSVLYWDSGAVNDSASVGIPYGGPELAIETTYYWTVTVTGRDGGVYVSDPAYFSTETDFEDASWIIPASQDNGAPMLRTEQWINGNVESANLYITALGVYTAYINGNEVMALDADGNRIDDIFNPGWTDYKYYVNYQTYDVAEYLQGTSKLALGVMLGTGWYAGDIGSAGNYGGAIGSANKNELALLAKLVINYDDGSQEVIKTNTRDWKSSDNSPVLSDDFFHGETYDANIAKSIAGWNDINYNDSRWSAVTADSYSGDVRPNSGAQARIAEEYTQTPVSGFKYSEVVSLSEGSDYEYGHAETEEVSLEEEIHLAPGEILILNMGQNIVGAAQITVSGEQNTTVTMRHAEMLNDGKSNPTNASGGSDGPKDTLYMRAITNADVTDRYILSADETQAYLPSFTYHGFQYLEITADNDIILKDVQGKVFTGVGEETGEINTDVSDLNKLVSNTKWSQLDNYLSIPTDCPQRGERAGWTGDAQLFAQTGVYNFDVIAFLESYTEVMNVHAENNNNKYTAIMPAAFMSFLAGNVSSGWSDAGIIIPWVLYLQTGDSYLIETYYDQMDLYMDYVMNNGYNASMFGDWLAFAGASTPYMNAVYQIYTTKLMQSMAQVIGDTAAERKYVSREENLRDTFMNTYVASDGTILSGTVQNAQTALLWALKLGLYEDETQKDIMVQNLIESIRNEGGSIRSEYPEDTLAVGFLGVNVILPVLSDVGASDKAYDLLLQTEMPSWLYSVQNGATTIWERWNSYSIENSFGDSGMNSFNHYSYGACLEWMYEYMLGIKMDTDNPGFSSIILQPTMDARGRIDDASGSYDSYYGTISSEWTADSGELLTYNAAIPANTSAVLYLPTEEDNIAGELPEGITYITNTVHNGEDAAVFEVEAGGYEFAVTEDGISVQVADGYKLSNITGERKLLGDTIADAEVLQGTSEFENAIESVKEYFTETLEEAKIAYANPNASGDELFDMYLKLSDAMARLGFQSGDKTVLLRLIQAAGLIDQDLYQPVTVDALMEALEMGTAIYADGDALAGDVDAAVEALRTSMNNLRYKANKETLQQVVVKAQNLQLARYTEESVLASNISSVLSAALIVLEDANAEQKDVDTATVSLQNAMKILELKGGEPDTSETSETGEQSEDTQAGTDDPKGETKDQPKDETSETGNGGKGKDETKDTKTTASSGKDNSTSGKSSVKTGDTIAIGSVVLLMAGAAGILLVARKRKIK